VPEACSNPPDQRWSTRWSTRWSGEQGRPACVDRAAATSRPGHHDPGHHDRSGTTQLVRLRRRPEPGVAAGYVYGWST